MINTIKKKQFIITGVYHNNTRPNRKSTKLKCLIKYELNIIAHKLQNNT